MFKRVLLGNFSKIFSNFSFLRISAVKKIQISAEPKHSFHLIFHLLIQMKFNFCSLTLLLCAQPSVHFYYHKSFHKLLELLALSCTFCVYFHQHEIHKIILLDYIFHEIMRVRVLFFFIITSITRAGFWEFLYTLNALSQYTTVVVDSKVIKFGLNRCSK